MTEHVPHNPAAGNADAVVDTPAGRVRGWRYPRAYAWFAFLAALDILLTYMIMSPLFDDRGREVNAVAEYVIDNYGLPGVVLYKYLLVGLVVLICEYVGRHQPSKGRRLAEWSVAITAIPVVVSFTLMLFDIYLMVQPAIVTH